MGYVEGINNGVIDSPYDSRDYTLDMLVSTASSDILPPSYRTPTTVPVLSQGSTSTCVACALASCRYIQEELQEGSASKFSVIYIYGNRLLTDTQNEGMIPRQALKTIVNFGDCHWDDFSGYCSYATAKSAYEADKERYDDLAYPYKINSYYSLSGVDEIKTAVYELGCAVISINTRTSFRCPGSDGYVEYDDTETIGGRHMVTVVGWTEDDHWVVLNSWGANYGDGGYCYLSFDYPINEAWSMVDDYRYADLKFVQYTRKAAGVFLGIKKKRYLC